MAERKPPPPSSSSKLAPPKPPSSTAAAPARSSSNLSASSLTGASSKPAAVTAKPVAAPAKPVAAKPVAVAAKPVAVAAKPAVAAPAPVAASKPPLLAKPSSSNNITINISERPVAPSTKPTLAPLEIPTETTSSLPPTPRSMVTTPRALLEMMTPPTVEEQDFIYLYVLSFLVPYFALRFVFEFTRRLVLGPVRLFIKWTPGTRKLLSFLYVRFGPLALQIAQAIQHRLPGMDYLNAVGRAGLERFLATLSVALAAAGPHLLELAESVKQLKFREAFVQAFALLKAWAPMILLLIPLLSNAFVVTKDGIVWFSQFSKTAIYRPFGSFLKRAVSSFGKALSENPEIFAETISGFIGPVVLLLLASTLVVWLFLAVGLFDYHTLSSLYMAWFFRLIGLVSEPENVVGVVVDDGMPTTGGAAAVEAGSGYW
ncbi:hypothetical protein BASA81_005798 [Batrachochytrium salamandrivorans]|nr:hypothetical protein BASA81_005798 [Batrachochytrium salamandrivorans]